MRPWWEVGISMLIALAVGAVVLWALEHEAPTTTIRLHSGETVACPYGVVWTPSTRVPTSPYGPILCRVSRKDGGFVFRSIALPDIDVLDAR